MTTPNTSATGGYLIPDPKFPTLPGSLTFKQFLQTVFVGISGLPGDLVRPKWQVNPPKQPDIDVDWMAFALTQNNADTNIYSGVDDEGNNQTQRMEQLEIQCSFIGPNADQLAALVRDGLQIAQNLEALALAKMGFVNTTQMMHVPELVNERWIDRYEMTVYFRREILRVYPVLNFASVNGVIETIVNTNLKTLAWNA